MYPADDDERDYSLESDVVDSICINIVEHKLCLIHLHCNFEDILDKKGKKSNAFDGEYTP